MARLGINPARGKSTQYRPARVTVVVLTYIPHLEGYFQQKLDILRLVVESIIKNTQYPFDLMIFDNGSCDLVIDYLQGLRDSGKVDYLLLSRRNIGKIDAMRMICRAAPGDLVAYSDDDILFYPGWLTKIVQILDSFPTVGMVSGVPVRNASRYAMNALNQWVQNLPLNASAEQLRFIPDEWERDWAISTGRDAQQHLKQTQQWLDWVVKYQQSQAIGGANHFQFVANREIMLQAIPKVPTGKLMGQMVELDEMLDRLGYLRLSTPERLTRHIGNVITESLTTEAVALGINIIQTNRRRYARRKRYLFMQIPGIRKFLRIFYNWLFRVLHGVSE